MMPRLLGLIVLIAAFLAWASPAPAIVIGHFAPSRTAPNTSFQERLMPAANALEAQGHILVETDLVTETFLAGVDAIYVNVLNSIDPAEVAALQDFVDNHGGLIFVQVDNGGFPYQDDATDALLAPWGIFAGTETGELDSTVQVVSMSPWVTNPHVVTEFSGWLYRALSGPSDFQELARSSLGDNALAVLECDPAAGRKGTVFVAADGEFWTDVNGWTRPANRDLWEDIWTTAAEVIVTCRDEDGDGYSPPEDCDETDPQINPGAVDLPGNLVDENCDGNLGDCDPCFPWRNHGEYVRCVAHAVEDLVLSGILTEEDGDVLVSSAAMSDIGKRGFVPPECQ